MTVAFREVREIRADAAIVYDVLADLAGYARWNPWIPRASGTVEEGALVEMSAELHGKLSRYEHRIVVAQRGRRLLWRDLGWFTIVAEGERDRHLTETAEGCRYEVELRIRGMMAGVVKRLYGRTLREGLAREADALKAHCESLPPS